MIVPVCLVSNEEFWLPFVLEASRGYFHRYVIYDIGSTDKTREIIQWFMDTSPGVEFLVKVFPMLDPKIQGTFRNSMIAETLSESYLILDGDEVYSPESYEKIIRAHVDNEKPYGVVRRIEVAGNLTEAYGLDEIVPHHRLYNNRMIWQGSHPGEYPYFEQTSEREIRYEDIVCYHFHNCARSSKDHEVPKRLDRRGRGTYRPGALAPIDILKELPILRQRIENFPRNPELIKLIEG